MTTELYSSTLETLASALGSIPFPSVTFIVEKAALRILSSSNLHETVNLDELPKHIDMEPNQLQEKLMAMPQNLFWLNGGEKVFNVSEDNKDFPELFEFASQLEFDKVSFFQVSSKKGFHGLVLVGSYKNHILSENDIKSFSSIIQLASSVLDQTTLAEQSQKNSFETEMLSTIVAAITTPWDTRAFFATLHEQIKKSIGEYPFIGALYDEKTDSIQVPYMFEEGEAKTIESFPIGEGLTSILIRTKQPLLINENTQQKAKELGAKVIGKPAKSWMGVPLLVENKAIGGIIIQDLEKENAFTKEHLKYMNILATQVAGILFNAMQLDENRNQNSKIQTAAEIARDISSALDLDELILKAVNLIRDRFNFYHAAIFLVDNTGANAVVREATGEAGAQMKRIGHKLAVGSKSVVGYVAGQGEPLVVNDTAQDATHLPNPLLSDTRAEAALPLKVGDRILGVLDVQSTIPFSFNQNDLNTMQILADQVGIAVSNTELFAEIQEHLSQHRLLHHIITSAASGTTLEEALSSTVKGLQVTLGGDRVAILLADADRKNLVVEAWVGYSEDASGLTVPFGSGITGWVASHKKPLRINDVTQDARYIQVSANTRSELALPLIFRKDILGVLNVESEQVAAYTENDEEMLGTLAGSLAAIITNARLVDQIRKQAERERLLYEITSKIRRSTDMQTILSTTINEINRSTGARRTKITIGAKENESTSIDGMQISEKESE
jgi:GAF domain-containing protein